MSENIFNINEHIIELHKRVLASNIENITFKLIHDVDTTLYYYRHYKKYEQSPAIYDDEILSINIKYIDKQFIVQIGKYDYNIYTIRYKSPDIDRLINDIDYYLTHPIITARNLIKSNPDIYNQNHKRKFDKYHYT